MQCTLTMSKACEEGLYLFLSKDGANVGQGCRALCAPGKRCVHGAWVADAATAPAGSLPPHGDGLNELPTAGQLLALTSGVMYPSGRPFDPMRTGDEGTCTHPSIRGLAEGAWHDLAPEHDPDAHEFLTMSRCISRWKAPDRPGR